MSVAVVTGGSRGIGRAISIELGRRGFTVVVNYRTTVAAAAEAVAAVEATGARAVAIAADVADPAAVTSLFQQTDALGTLGVLVCNAGITRDTLLGASTPADFTDVLAVNLHGVASCCRAASIRMMAKRAGAIVTLSSVAAQRPGRGQSNYAASKGAVEAFTRSLAVELASRNVTVNAVAPGLVETEMTDGVGEALLESVPARRAGTPEEVAACVRFLAGEQAGYVTGTTLTVDGGMSA